MKDKLLNLYLIINVFSKKQFYTIISILLRIFIVICVLQKYLNQYSETMNF